MLQTLRKSIQVSNFLTVTTVFTETLRSYPWLIFLSGLGIPGWTEPPLSLLSALIIMGITTTIVSLTIRRGLHLNEARLATLGLGIVMVIVLTRLENGGGYALWDTAWFGYAADHMIPIVVALVFGLFLLWRGIVIGREELGTDRLYRSFAIGIAGFILLMPTWAVSLGMSSGQRLFSILLPYVLTYFAISLMGLGLANFLSLRSGMGARPKASDLFARRWLILLTVVVLMIVCVSLVISSSLSLNLITAIIHPLNVAAEWLLNGFLFVLGYPIGYLVTGLYWIIGIIASWIRGLNNKPFETPEIDFGEMVEDIQTGNMPIEILTVLKWVIFVVAVAIIMFFLWRSLYRYWRGTQEKGYEEIHESLWGNFGADLRSMLKGLADRFRRNAGGHAVPPLAATMTDADQIISVRELYRGLLWVGAESGYPKTIEQTPYEYQKVLEQAIVAEQESIATITGAYVQERYGHIQASREHILSLVRQWLNLRAALRTSQDNDSPEK
jgi:hypothetical protein